MGSKMLAARYYGKEGSVAIALALMGIVAVDIAKMSG